HDPMANPVGVVHLRIELGEVRDLRVIPFLYEATLQPFRPEVVRDLDHVEHITAAGGNGLLQKFRRRARGPRELAAERFEFRAGDLDDVFTPGAGKRGDGQSDAVESLLLRPRA